MAGEQNLIRNEDRTPEERRENARKAGVASGAARRERRALKDSLLTLLGAPVQDENGEDSGLTMQEQVALGLVMRAAKGDPRAFEVIRDTIGEKPVQQVEITKPKAEIADEIEAMLGGSA